MDLIYERKQTLKVAVLRTVFFFLIFALIFLFLSDYRDYCILIAIIFPFLIFLSVTELKLFSNRVEIKIYYVFGIAHRNYVLKREHQPTVIPYEIEVETNPDEGHLFSGTFLFKYYKVTYKKEEIEKRFDLTLTDAEYKKMTTILN